MEPAPTGQGQDASPPSAAAPAVGRGWRPGRPLLLGLAVFGIVLLNGLRWSLRIPYNRAPDEYEHAATQAFVAEHGRLPRFGEGRFHIHLLDGITREPVYARLNPDTGELECPRDQVPDLRHRFEVRQPYLFAPQAAHWLGGWYAALTGGYSVLKARSFSALCVALAAVFVYAAGLRLARSPYTAAAAGIGFALWPQVSFLGAYVNDDAYALMATAALLWACTRVETAGLSRGRAVVLGCAAGGVLLSTYYAYAALPVAGVWALRVLHEQGRPGWRLLLLAALVATGLATPWFAGNARHYHGDLLGLRTVAEAKAAFVRALPRDLAARTAAARVRGPGGVPVLRPGAWRTWLRLSALSAYACFGWMPQVPVAVALYGLGLATLAVPWLARLLLRPPPAGPGGRSWTVPLFGLPLLAVLVALSVYNSLTVDVQAQGRCLLPCVPGLVLLTAMSLERFCRRSPLPVLAWIASFLVQNAWAATFVH